MRTIFGILFFLAALPACGQPVDVMTYNIRFDNPGDGVNRWDNRKQRVFDLIKKYDPDVLGVQEAMHHQLEDITRNLPEYVFAGAGRDDGKAKGEYSAILYRKQRFELTDQSTFWLSETPAIPGSKSWDAAITRVATWAKLKDKHSGDEFLVLNTHFDHIGKEARKESAEIIISRTASLAAGMPVIITGDLNCTRDDEPYRLIMETSRLSLTDPAPEQDPPGTFCNFAVGGIPCRAIDYIFYSDHWSGSRYQVPADNDGKNYPSDHLPVLVTVTMKD